MKDTRYGFHYDVIMNQLVYTCIIVDICIYTFIYVNLNFSNIKNCDKKFKISRDSSLELYKISGSAIIKGTLLVYFKVT